MKIAIGGLRTRLGELGEVDMDKLARDCAAHPLMNNNPVKLDEAAIAGMVLRRSALLSARSFSARQYRRESCLVY